MDECRTTAASKYFLVRILSGALFMGSLGMGAFVGAEYGKWVGLLVFIVLAPMGIVLHVVADRMKKT